MFAVFLNVELAFQKKFELTNNDNITVRIKYLYYIAILAFFIVYNCTKQGLKSK